MIEQRGRPVTLEVTPAMIEAGEIAAAWAGEEISSETVAAVYNAMVVAKLFRKLSG